MRRSRNVRWKIENRTLGVWVWTLTSLMLFFSAGAQGEKSKSDVATILLQAFPGGTPIEQKSLLRQVGLVGSSKNIQELVRLGLVATSDSEVRREIIKAIIALDREKKYRSMVATIRSNQIDERAMINAVVGTEDEIFIDSLVEFSMRLDTSRRLQKKSVLGILNLWNKASADFSPLRSWRGTEVEIQLKIIAEESVGSRKKLADAILKYLATY